MFVRLLAYSAVIVLAAVFAAQISGDEDKVRAALEKEYLRGFEALSDDANGKSEIFKAFVSEVKANRAQIVEDEICDQFLWNVSVTAGYVKVRALDVEGMLANLSAKVEDVVACFRQEGGWEGPTGEPCNTTNSTVDRVHEFNDFISCLGKPVSDALDCLDDQLGRLEAMRQDYLNRTAGYEADFEERMSWLYGDLKRCLFEMRPTVGPSAANTYRHTALLIIFPLATILTYLR